MSDTGEINLYRWVNQLPRNHKARLQFASLSSTIGLLNSMVLCGEQHSNISLEEVENAQRIFHGKD